MIAGVATRRTFVTAGEPVAELPIFTEYKTCWFGVSRQFKDALCQDGSHTAILIGSKPVWNPALWQEKLTRHASLRAQINRAANKGVTIQQSRSPIGLSDCQSDWLGRLRFEPLKFLTEPVDFEDADKREFFIARQKGRIVGYLVATPTTNGRLVEEIARRSDAPNGTTESLIAFAMDHFAEQDIRSVTLGLAPLSTLGAPNESEAAGTVGAALRHIRANGNSFYNFKGIEYFKAKMQPDEWVPVYAVVRGNWRLGHLGAISEAFTGESPTKSAAKFAYTSISHALKSIVNKH